VVAPRLALLELTSTARRNENTQGGILQSRMKPHGAADIRGCRYRGSLPSGLRDEPAAFRPVNRNKLLRMGPRL
jgi:hypothetical protein